MYVDKQMHNIFYKQNKTMRDLKTLYTLVLEEIDNMYPDFHGICIAICGINLNSEERKILRKDFKERKPNIFNKFWWKWSFNKIPLDAYWWECNKLGLEQRKLFLKDIISKL